MRFLPRDAGFEFTLLLASPSSMVALGFLEQGLAVAVFKFGTLCSRSSNVKVASVQ
jgi:hypothetical protein